MTQHPPTNVVLTGDNLALLRERFPDGCADLIYLDPPFQSGKDYGGFSDVWKWDDAAAAACAEFEAHGPAPAAALLRGFHELLGPGQAMAYLAMMAPRLAELRRVLAETGSLYLHCDPAMSHYLKLLLDALFGPKNFRSEIIWRIGWISGFKTRTKKWVRNHDVILYYTQSDRFTFHKVHLPRESGYRRRAGAAAKAPGVPLEDVWGLSPEEGLTSIQIMSFSREKTGWPTQKPLALLERIVAASSDPGGLVLDPFCGSGTALVAAARLGRRYAGIDRSAEATALAAKRLADVAPLLVAEAAP